MIKGEASSKLSTEKRTTLDVAEATIEALDRKFTTPYQKAVMELTPKYFECLGWIAALAALQYAYVKTGSWSILPLMAVGYLASFLYLNLVFIAAFEQLLKRARPIMQKMLSAMLGATLLWGVSKMIGDAVSAIVATV